MNHITLTGRLTRDPEVRYTSKGDAVASFSIAVDTGWGDNKRTDFIPITCWRKTAEVVGNNLTKGRRVLVEGRLQISEYEKDGQKRRSTDVVASNVEFLDSKKDGQPSPASADVNQFGADVNIEEEILF